MLGEHHMDAIPHNELLACIREHHCHATEPVTRGHTASQIHRMLEIGSDL